MTGVAAADAIGVRAKRLAALARAKGDDESESQDQSQVQAALNKLDSELASFAGDLDVHRALAAAGVSVEAATDLDKPAKALRDRVASQGRPTAQYLNARVRDVVALRTDIVVNNRDAWRSWAEAQIESLPVALLASPWFLPGSGKGANSAAQVLGGCPAEQGRCPVIQDDAEPGAGRSGERGGVEGSECLARSLQQGRRTIAAFRGYRRGGGVDPYRLVTRRSDLFEHRMTHDPWAGIPDLLDRLEDAELPLLSWGVVDGFLSASEIDAAIETQLDVDATRGGVLLTSEQYLEHLLDTGLLHRLPEAEPRYRTRFAETLRLLRNLRQLLPREQTKVGWWRKSNALVADYRLRTAPRRYPARVVAIESVIGELEQLDGWTTTQANVARNIIGSDDSARFQVQATRSILSALRGGYPAARIITAGTGSGKTRAFYLPALLDIAATLDVVRSGPHTLALYPRKELLRDQARETLRVITNLGHSGAPAAGQVGLVCSMRTRRSASRTSRSPAAPKGGPNMAKVGSLPISRA